ncbi:MAG: hypothetical protein KAR09_03785 [Bacteroidales bacterium]|nr:hypothetical protein [Bacteroidales bacterium]
MYHWILNQGFVGETSPGGYGIYTFGDDIGVILAPVANCGDDYVPWDYFTSSILYPLPLQKSPSVFLFLAPLFSILYSPCHPVPPFHCPTSCRYFAIR